MVGIHARKLFEDGILIDKRSSDAIVETKLALKQRKPIFEATFSAEKMLSKADILVPVKGDQWDIIEVKSATRVKDIDIDDVAFQKNCYDQAGVKIRKSFVMHINCKYVRDGSINTKKLFTQEEVTNELRNSRFDISLVKDMINIINGPEPKCNIGPHAFEPYEYPLWETCWNLPEHNVFEIGKRKAFELINEKILALDKIPNDFKLSLRERTILDCVKNNKIFIDKNAINKTLINTF
tara:strand:- start:754 stop:1467 length:714 start_codon:yes stop_codon:yes gene_type:complete